MPLSMETECQLSRLSTEISLPIRTRPGGVAVLRGRRQLVGSAPITRVNDFYAALEFYDRFVKALIGR
jgi:hypothetical protein